MRVKRLQSIAKPMHWNPKYNIDNELSLNTGIKTHQNTQQIVNPLRGEQSLSKKKNKSNTGVRVTLTVHQR